MSGKHMEMNELLFCNSLDKIHKLKYPPTCCLILQGGRLHGGEGAAPEFPSQLSEMTANFFSSTMSQS